MESILGAAAVLLVLLSLGVVVTRWYWKRADVFPICHLQPRVALALAIMQVVVICNYAARVMLSDVYPEGCFLLIAAAAVSAQSLLYEWRVILLILRFRITDTVIKLHRKRRRLASGNTPGPPNVYMRNRWLMDPKYTCRAVLSASALSALFPLVVLPAVLDTSASSSQYLFRVSPAAIGLATLLAMHATVMTALLVKFADRGEVEDEISARSEVAMTAAVAWAKAAIATAIMQTGSQPEGANTRDLVGATLVAIATAAEFCIVIARPLRNAIRHAATRPSRASPQENRDTRRQLLSLVITRDCFPAMVSFASADFKPEPLFFLRAVMRLKQASAARPLSDQIVLMHKLLRKLEVLALSIYDLYIDEPAPCRVDLPPAITDELSALVSLMTAGGAAQAGHLSSLYPTSADAKIRLLTSLFDEAIDDVIRVTHADAFLVRFYQSEKYQDLLHGRGPPPFNDDELAPDASSAVSSPPSHPGARLRASSPSPPPPAPAPSPARSLSLSRRGDDLLPTAVRYHPLAPQHQHQHQQVHQQVQMEVRQPRSLPQPYRKLRGRLTSYSSFRMPNPAPANATANATASDYASGRGQSAPAPAPGEPAGPAHDMARARAASHGPATLPHAHAHMANRLMPLPHMPAGIARSFQLRARSDSFDDLPLSSSSSSSSAPLYLPLPGSTAAPAPLPLAISRPYPLAISVPVPGPPGILRPLPSGLRSPASAPAYDLLQRHQQQQQHQRNRSGLSSMHRPSLSVNAPIAPRTPRSPMSHQPPVQPQGQSPLPLPAPAARSPHVDRAAAAPGAAEGDASAAAAGGYRYPRRTSLPETPPLARNASGNGNGNGNGNGLPRKTHPRLSIAVSRARHYTSSSAGTGAATREGTPLPLPPPPALPLSSTPKAAAAGRSAAAALSSAHRLATPLSSTAGLPDRDRDREREREREREQDIRAIISGNGGKGALPTHGATINLPCRTISRTHSGANATPAPAQKRPTTFISSTPTPAYVGLRL